MEFERINPEVRGKAAKHAGAIIGDQIFGKAGTRPSQMILCPAIGAAGPIGRIEQLAIGRHGLDTAKRIGGVEQPQDLPPARAFGQQRGDVFAAGVRRAADPGDDIDGVAELLENRVVRDRADLAQAHLAVGVDIALTARHAAAGGIEQPQPERGNGAGIGAAGEVIALMILHRAIEIEADVGAVVKRISGRGEIGFRRAQLGNAGEGGKRQFRRGEEQVAITALKANLGFQPDACASKPPPRPGR